MQVDLYSTETSNILYRSFSIIISSGSTYNAASSDTQYGFKRSTKISLVPVT